MINELISKEVENFLDQELEKQKEAKAKGQDPELKKYGINKNYLDKIQELLSNKKLSEAKKLLSELDAIIAKITDNKIKEKAGTIRTECRNSIELFEMIEKSKKNLELKIKSIKNSEKKSFLSSNENEGVAAKKLKEMITKGINSDSEKKQQHAPESFFTSTPSQITVVQKIMTPEQPMPSQKSINQTQEEVPQQNTTVEQPTQTITPTPSIITVPTPVPAPTIAPSGPDPKIEQEKFSRASFVIQELQALIEEKDLEEAKNEYSRARSIIEGMAESEEKRKISSQLFSEYHSLKRLEKELIKQKELAEEKKYEQRKNEEINRQKKLIEELRNQEAEKKIIVQPKEVIIKPDNIDIHSKNIDMNPETIDISTRDHKDIQQEILEEKHRRIIEGIDTTPLVNIQEELNNNRALKIPTQKNSFEKINVPITEEIKKEVIKEKPITSKINIVKEKKLVIPKTNSEEIKFFGEKKETDSLYNQAVSMLYQGDKLGAKKLLEQILKYSPNNLAAKIRLKECNL